MTMLLPKRTRERCQAHLRFIRTLPCAACGVSATVQAHHLTISPDPKARGLKASDRWTAPLCLADHLELHMRGDERAWWAALGRDPIALAERLWAMSIAAGRA
jgi:hypothetical protein